MLRPMSNLIAISHRDARFLALVENELRRTGEFDLVWQPAPGWVAGRAPLPGSEPDSEAVWARGFAFLEGRDVLERAPGNGWLDRVSRVVDRAAGRLYELPGDFAFVRFRADGAASAVRSCGGLVPLYVHRSRSGAIAIGSRLSYFPRFLPGPFTPDPLVNASFPIVGTFIDGRTFVEGVQILPRASHTQLASGRHQDTTIYWDPRPDEGDVPMASAEHPIELRRLLIEVLERDLDPQGRNLISLSGGVDSSTLAALAAGVVGRKLSSISLIPPDGPDRTRELSYIEEIVTRFKIDPAHRIEETAETWDRWFTQQRGLPFQAAHPVLAELPRICRHQDVRVLFGGEGADDVCGDWSRFGDWLRHTSALGLLRTARANLPYGPRDYLRWAKQRVLDAAGRPLIPGPQELDPWVHPDVQSEFHEWLARRHRTACRDRRPLRQLALMVQEDGWVPMNWEGTTPLGIRRSVPFFCREVLELAFQCHPSELLGPGRKRLLRAAVRDDVPARNLFRADNGTWDSTIERSQLAPLLRARGAERMIRSDWLPVPPAEATFDDLMLMWSALSVANWLEQANTAQADSPLRVV